MYLGYQIGLFESLQIGVYLFHIPNHCYHTPLTRLGGRHLNYMALYFLTCILLAENLPQDLTILLYKIT